MERAANIYACELYSIPGEIICSIDLYHTLLFHKLYFHFPLLTYTSGVAVVLCRRVIHLYHGHAEVDPQGVHVEEAEEAEYRQRVSSGDPRERVDSA